MYMIILYEVCYNKKWISKNKKIFKKLIELFVLNLQDSVTNSIQFMYGTQHYPFDGHLRGCTW
jgi:hypothetical protein